MSCCSEQLLLKTAILKVKTGWTGWSALSLLGMARKPKVMWKVKGEFRPFEGHSAGAGSSKRALLAQHGAEGEGQIGDHDEVQSLYAGFAGLMV